MLHCVLSELGVFSDDAAWEFPVEHLAECQLSLLKILAPIELQLYPTHLVFDLAEPCRQVTSRRDLAQRSDRIEDALLLLQRRLAQSEQLSVSIFDYLVYHLRHRTILLEDTRICHDK